MKNIAIIALLMTITFSSFSQDSLSFKPSNNDWNLEINAEPFGDSPISINYIRLRKFKEDGYAIRIGVSIAGKVEEPTETTKLTTYSLNIRPGIEKHFTGSKRLSPYIGGEIDMSYKSSKKEVENGSSIKGAWDEFGQERGYTRIGANFVSGVDIYILKGFYIGTEVGYGFGLTKTADLDVENNTSATRKGGSAIQFGPNFNSSFRLGYIFK